MLRGMIFMPDRSGTAFVKGAGDKSNRNFGLVMGVFFVAVGVLPLVHGGGLRPWALILAGAVIVCAIVQPVWLRPLNYVWHKLGLALHVIINPLIMAVIFYAAITPMGVLVRLFGKDLLRLKWEPKATSYWIPREPGPTPESMTKQF